jgi:hypothetical protein
MAAAKTAILVKRMSEALTGRSPVHPIAVHLLNVEGSRPGQPAAFLVQYIP